MRLTSLRTVVWSGLAILAVLAAGVGNTASAQKKAESGGKAKAAAGEKKAKAPRGRLPAYYAQVVDEKQREAIYKIQQEYEPKIADLLHDKTKLGEWMETVPEAPELEAGAEKKKGK